MSDVAREFVAGRRSKLVKYEKGQRSYDALVDAAAYEFGRHGVAGARITDILQRAEMTQGAMYHHFTTKQEVADFIVQENATIWQSNLDEARKDGVRGLDGAARDARVIASILQENVRVRAALRIANDLDDPTPRAIWKSALVLSLQQAIADREVSEIIDVQQTADLLVDCIHGICLAETRALDSGTVDTKLDRLWEIVSYGIRSA